MTKPIDFSNLLNHIPLDKFTKEQKRCCILVWVAIESKLKYKDYNLPKMPTGYSTRLYAKGRGEMVSKNYMPDRIGEQIFINLSSANNEEELKIIAEELVDDIVEQCLILSEDLLYAARNAKSESVRLKYYNGMRSIEYLKVVFIISVTFFAK